jgi:uncharacterized DUF497 family protein
MDFARFDWDSGNVAKCQKHGVSIAEVESVFRGQVRIAPDLEHSLVEERLKAIGVSGAGRNVLIAFTVRLRGADRLIRPVSARYMHAREVAHYEKETSDAPKR